MTQLAFTYLPWLQRLFQTDPVRAEAWLYIVGIGILIVAAVEMENWLRFRAPRSAEKFLPSTK